MDFPIENMDSSFQMGPTAPVDNTPHMTGEYLGSFSSEYARTEAPSYDSMEQISYGSMGQNLYGAMEQRPYEALPGQTSYGASTAQPSYGGTTGAAPYSAPTAQASYNAPPGDTLYGGPAAEEASHVPMEDVSNGSEEHDVGSPGLKLQGYTVAESRRKGKKPKRRGPKPDTKPALTRRQELNRQAQRTHRQRKEVYMNNLEREIHRLKEIYTEVCQERDVFKDENQKLKDLLNNHGISIPENISRSSSTQKQSSEKQESQHQETPQQDTQHQETQSVAAASVIGNADTVQDDLTPRSTSSTGNGNGNGAGASPMVVRKDSSKLPARQLIDYDQIGIEFVLALEKPCMDHTQMLCARSESDERGISGHALMATSPPRSHLRGNNDEQYPHKLPDMNPADLRRLLDLSNRLPLKDEVTPVMAWSRIMQDHRIGLLTPQHFMDVKDELQSKIHCYGFGAVVEEFEVRDAIEAVLAPRKDNYLSAQEPPRAPQALPAVAVHG